MYKLIRRISSSFFPRPDRPWSEDATSTAPQIGRKRRLSSTEPDEVPSSVKRYRLQTEDGEEELSRREPSTFQPAKDTQDVKEVTKGVEEVDLEEGKQKELDTPGDAAAIPLPDSPELKATQESTKVDDVSLESVTSKLVHSEDEGIGKSEGGEDGAVAGDTESVQVHDEEAGKAGDSCMMGEQAAEAVSSSDITTALPDTQKDEADTETRKELNGEEHSTDSPL